MLCATHSVALGDRKYVSKVRKGKCATYEARDTQRLDQGGSDWVRTHTKMGEKIKTIAKNNF